METYIIHSYFLHFIVSFLLVIIFSFISRRPPLALFITLLIGISKEVYDINVNIYHLAPNALLLDCLGDLFFDFVGVLSAYLIVREKKTKVISFGVSRTWYWTEEWQEGEHEADADIKAGRVKKYSSAEDFLASLDDEEEKK